MHSDNLRINRFIVPDLVDMAGMINQCIVKNTLVKFASTFLNCMNDYLGSSGACVRNWKYSCF